MASSRDREPATSAVELLGIIGFGCFVSWMLLSFYWLFSVLFSDMDIGARDVAQTFVFAGIAIGYVVMHALGRLSAFDPFSPAALVVMGVLAAFMPACALALSLGAIFPMPAMCIVNVLGGMGGAGLTVCWVDVCSRLGEGIHGRFCATSFLCGSVLFLITSAMPVAYQPAFAVLYIVPCVLFLSYTDRQKPLRRSEEDLTNTNVPLWKFTREVEPTHLMFGTVFAFTFVFLFNDGAQALFIGLVGVVVGSAAALIASRIWGFISITVIQRALVCVLVLTCLCTPFVSWPVQVACALLGIAAWGFFMPLTYGHLARKSASLGHAAAFRQVPLRLFVSALGYVVGWAIAAGMTMAFGSHSGLFVGTRLALVFVLVLLVMVFFPNTQHHSELADVETAAQQAAKQSLDQMGMSSDAAFEARCAGVAQLYQLSPRETEVLGYLARGRNAAYIEEKLCISSHTVKSHIYNIYRKTDIHSQQRLMDFVEGFSLDV